MWLDRFEIILAIYFMCAWEFVHCIATHLGVVCLSKQFCFFTTWNDSCWNTSYWYENLVLQNKLHEFLRLWDGAYFRQITNSYRKQLDKVLARYWTLLSFSFVNLIFNRWRFARVVHATYCEDSFDLLEM